jgi:carboxyl-terminal processing protease
MRLLARRPKHAWIISLAAALALVAGLTLGAAAQPVPTLAPPAPAAAANDPFANGKAAYERKDYADALRWFKTAADEGRPDGLAGLGVLYGLGLGVPANDNTAVRLFRKAAPNTDTPWVGDVRKMLSSVDPHSDYLTPSSFAELSGMTRGEFGGLGLEITLDGGKPKVVSPIDDTPAARAGLQAGDLILGVDGVPSEGLSLDKVVSRMRGEPGTTVRLTIGRAAQNAFDVTLTRATIQVNPVKARLEAGRIGYVRISQFNEHADERLRDALDALTRQAGGRLDGLVLDLRNDPGGLLQQAVAVAGDFLDGGTVVRLVAWRGRIMKERGYAAPAHGDRLPGVPIVVLINGASASAAEIVAGALQDHRRARVLGSRSFGKGTVQTIMPLDGHGALKLTTHEYQLPSGRTIQAQGVVPDEIVLPGDEGRTQPIPREADLRDGTPPSDTDPQIEHALIGTERDHQLAAALRVLRDGAASGRR